LRAKVMKRIHLVVLVIGFLHFVQLAQADWTPAKRLTWNPGQSRSPAMAVDSKNTIHVVWADDTDGNYEIWYKKSTDGGTAWSTVKRLSWTPADSYVPTIAIDSKNCLHLIWDEPVGIYYRRSPDGGATWSAPKKLSSLGSCPVIGCDSSNQTHVAWYFGDLTPESSDADIWYTKSTDGGTAWSTAMSLSPVSGANTDPAIAVDPYDHIHIVWENDNWDPIGQYTYPNDLYYTRSNDGGITWIAAKRLTWTSGSTNSPAIAIGNNSVHVVWTDGTPQNAEIYYVRSTDGGKTWGTAKRLTWTSGESSDPATGISSDGHLHAIWADRSPGTQELFYKRSTDGGGTWTTSRRITWTITSCEGPAIAMDSSNTVHVVWSMGAEIYYKNGK
jgi:hypothetical protein